MRCSSMEHPANAGLRTNISYISYNVVPRAPPKFESESSSLRAYRFLDLFMNETCKVIFNSYIYIYINNAYQLVAIYFL